MNACPACGADLPDAARFCPSCAAPVVVGRAERERKLATVIFADLVGSTELAGSQDPERTRVLLERFYDAMAQEINAAGGTVEKFAGDAVMAAFGAPTALEDHAERALHVALALQRRMGDLFGDRLALRIGVNTGEVVVGAAREGSSFVTGDPVNVAARLEQAAEPGEVLVGERTVAAARGAFDFADSRVIEAKGKSQGVACRRLVGALSLMRPRGVAGLGRPFVGRGEELGALVDVYDDVVAQRRPRLVTVLGDAGVGKTRLLREFWEHLGGSAPRSVRRTGRCLSYGQGITYWALGEVVKEHFGLLDTDPPAVVLERLGSRPLLGLSLGIDVAPGLHPLAARDRFQDGWIDFLEEVVTDRPMVLLIEDIHWAEDQLLDLLERLVADTAGPLMLVVTARPEALDRRPGWGARVPATTVALEALSAADAVRMLDELLGGTLPGGLRNVVVDRAEGNPFFVEELVATLIDRQLLQRRNGSWSLAALPSDFLVPDTVSAVVAARVDLLEPAEKQALQAAAVIGRVFWAGPVYDLVEPAEPDLHILEERDFIRRRVGTSMAGEREFAIKHALTREVAYSGVPRARRAGLHAAFARWLDAVGESERDEHASLLAHHYAEAVRPEDVDLAWAGQESELADLRGRALAALWRAGHLAIGRFEIDDGLALLQRALELAHEPAPRVALWREIGHANAVKLDGEAFWAAMLQALEGSDPATAADTYSQLAFHTATRGLMWKRRLDPTRLTQWIDQALEFPGLAPAPRVRALVARVFSDPQQFAVQALEARELAEQLDDVEGLSWAWAATALVAIATGDYADGYAWARRRHQLLPRLTDPDHIGLIHWFTHATCIADGRLDEAGDAARSLDEVSQRLSPHHRLHAICALVDVEVAAGRWERTCEFTARVEADVVANRATPCALEVWTLLGCALAHVHQGNEDEARRLEQVSDDLGMEGYDQYFACQRIEIAVARGDLPTLERTLATWDPSGLEEISDPVAHLNALVALQRRDRIEEVAPRLVIPGSYLEPFALRALGFARRDDALIQRAVDRFDEMGLAWFVAQTQQMLVPD
jgi:class 3 adenylate cyclase